MLTEKSFLSAPEVPPTPLEYLCHNASLIFTKATNSLEILSCSPFYSLHEVQCTRNWFSQQKPWTKFPPKYSQKWKLTKEISWSVLHSNTSSQKSTQISPYFGRHLLLFWETCSCDQQFNPLTWLSWSTPQSSCHCFCAQTPRGEVRLRNSCEWDEDVCTVPHKGY